MFDLFLRREQGHAAGAEKAREGEKGAEVDKIWSRRVLQALLKGLDFILTYLIIQMWMLGLRGINNLPMDRHIQKMLDLKFDSYLVDSSAYCHFHPQALV